MSGWILLTIGLIVSATDFLVGAYLARLTPDKLQRNADGSVRSPEQAHRVGRLLMIVSPLFFLVLAALAFGLFGPIGGIETISLNQG